MIERVTKEGERHAGRDGDSTLDQPRLSLVWYFDPTTGKPAACWAKAPDVRAVQELAAAA